MRCVVQRVSKAAVRVNAEKVGQINIGQINKGILALVGVENNDNDKDVSWLADKLLGLRIFEDGHGKMNLSILDVGGELLIVSQFTLLGDCRKGKRPSFSDAAPPAKAESMFDKLVETLRASGVKVETGQFQAKMDVELINDGPVTILLDSKKNF
ncbi:MAG: D-tyrosyl-tRNA(Tyr) deacylase [Peptococcaceae bacterium]|jgi:D-tyrosyl-tRNA(Tyr) deacylase|nr:D-tyrosyl-tRNA(Tyr) deacylase [Peptococcaceae bacterium]